MNRPEREPDITLPQSGGKIKIEVWIEECVFGRYQGIKLLDYPESMNVNGVQLNPIEYINHSAYDESSTEHRRAVACNYLADKALLDE